MMNSIRPTVLIIDDESKIRRLLSRSLDGFGFDVLLSASAEEAMFLLEKSKPDIIILDYMMPQVDGLTFLSEMRKRYSIPTIFLSARDEVRIKTKALELGADDYVVKPFSMEELTARIKAVLRRSRVNSEKAPEQTVHNGDLVMFPDRRMCRYKDADIKFADTEFRLLLVLNKRPGTIFTHEDLLRQVWGAEYIGELNYLRVSFSRIRKKLTEAGLAGTAIASYSGIGYYIEDLSEEVL